MASCARCVVMERRTIASLRAPITFRPRLAASTRGGSRDEHVALPGVAADAGRHEPGMQESFAPSVARKKSTPVAVVEKFDGAVRLPQHDREIEVMSGGADLGGTRPRHIAETTAATVPRVVPTDGNAGFKRLGDVVGKLLRRSAPDAPAPLSAPRRDPRHWSYT